MRKPVLKNMVLPFNSTANRSIPERNFPECKKFLKTDAGCTITGKVDAR